MLLLVHPAPVAAIPVSSMWTIAFVRKTRTRGNPNLCNRDGGAETVGTVRQPFAPRDVFGNPGPSPYPARKTRGALQRA